MRRKTLGLPETKRKQGNRFPIASSGIKRNRKERDLEIVQNGFGGLELWLMGVSVGCFMLTLSQISKSYGGRTLFRGVSLQIQRGGRIGLVGPNGAGKSTLFSIILGENLPDGGEVMLEKRSTLGFLPQESAP